MWNEYNINTKFPNFYVKNSSPSRVYYYGKDTLLASYQMQRASLLVLSSDTIIQKNIIADTERFQIIYVDKNGIIYFFSKYNIYILYKKFEVTDTVAYPVYHKTLAITDIKQHPQTGDIFFSTDGQGVYKIKN